MKDFFFRKATKDDLPAVAAIYDKIITAEENGEMTVGWVRDVYPTLQTASDAADRGELYVCEHDGKVAASGIINPTQVDVYAKASWKETAGAPDKEVCVLHTLTVSPDISVRGCGTAFVRFYENFAASHGCRYLRIDTNALNTRARSLYAKLGYDEADTVHCTFNNIRGIDLVCLEKKLPVCIRKYVPRDKEDLRFVCRATADKIFKHSDATRTAVTLLYNDYFTEYEPENVFVLANADDRAVGYIICCSNYDLFRDKMLNEYMKKTARVCPFLAVLAPYAVHEAEKMREYPHLHMDILPDFQRQGWGTRLMDALRNRLRENGFEKLSVCGAAKDSAGYKMYTKYGFKTVKSGVGGRVTLVIDT